MKHSWIVLYEERYYIHGRHLITRYELFVLCSAGREKSISVVWVTMGIYWDVLCHYAYRNLHFYCCVMGQKNIMPLSSNDKSAYLKVDHRPLFAALIHSFHNLLFLRMAFPFKRPFIHESKSFLIHPIWLFLLQFIVLWLPLQI